MSNMISALIKRPCETPKHVNLSDRIESLQKTVGGYIEQIRITRDMVLLCDEDGKLKELPYNCTVCGVDYVGTIVIVGYDADGFADLPVDWKTMKKLLPQLWKKAPKNG